MIRETLYCKFDFDVQYVQWNLQIFVMLIDLFYVYKHCVINLILLPMCKLVVESHLC